jgi:hypothetical protein
MSLSLTIIASQIDILADFEAEMFKSVSQRPKRIPAYGQGKGEVIFVFEDEADHALSVFLASVHNLIVKK